MRKVASYVWGFASDSVRKCDIFGEDIKLNYKGKDKFKTLLGGCASLFILAVMTAYIIFLTNRVFDKKGSNTTLSTTIKDLQVNPEEHQPGLGGFRIVVGAADRTRTIFYNESYFKFEVYEATNVRNGITVTMNETRNINLTECDSDTYQKLGIAGYSEEDQRKSRCLADNNYTLSGTYASDAMKYLVITMRKCNVYLGDTNCVSNEEINRKMNGGMISLILLNSYVDFDDYDNVIKTYADDRFFHLIREGFTKESDLFVRKNHVVLADEFFQMGQTENKEFYSAETSKTDFDLDSNNLVYSTIYVRMEGREDTYERTVFSVFDYTGLIGGVFEILEVLGSFLVGYFAKKWFMFSILSNLYQVQSKSDGQVCLDNLDSDSRDSSTKKQAEEVPKLREKSEEEKLGGQPKDEKSDEIELNKINLNDIATERKSLKPPPEKHKPLLKNSLGLMYKLKTILQHRRRYAFSCCDYWFSYISCLFCNKKTKSHTSLSFRNALYNDGLNRFRQETDTIEILKSVRMLKVLVKILLSNDQIKLLALEDSNILCKDIKSNPQLKHQIVQNEHGIQVSSSNKQGKDKPEPKEPHVEVEYKDLPKNLSKQIDDEFAQKIDKIVTEFGSQENNAQNQKLLKMAFGFLEDDFEKERQETYLSQESQSEDLSCNEAKEKGTAHVQISNYPIFTSKSREKMSKKNEQN